MEYKPLKIGQRIEIPVYYDLWMRGARFGEITQYRKAKEGRSAHYLVKIDHPQVKRRLKLWALDFDYVKII